MGDVRASIYFLARRKLYHTEQPYSLRYTGEEQISRTNIELDRRDDIRVCDIRGREGDYSLERNGFAISRIDSRMHYQDFEDPEQVVSVYCQEVASHLKRLLGARHVQIYEHLVSSFLGKD